MPFNLEHGDILIPEFCPVLGFKMSHSKRNESKDYSPTVDRIIPELGYVRGNIVVVSGRANQIKSNATVDELERVAAFYRQLIPQEGTSHAAETY